MRIEKDSMGTMKVPNNSYYGAQTQRAVENFQISNIALPNPMIISLGIIKRSAAIVNHKLKLLDEKRKDAIVQASDEVISGNFNDQFLVDVFQTGPEHPAI